MYLATARKLHARGVLGLNQRNADFVLRYNKRKDYPLVDDKLITKKLALEVGLSVPDLYGVVEHDGDLKKLPELLHRLDDFVVKPAQGSTGDGIIVITGRLKGSYRTAGGSLLSESDLLHHVSNALAGLYSLGGHTDRVFLEALVICDPVFDAVAYQGVPDVRIVVFLGVPVMAMVRLPTRISDGKANLHQGAIGVGIDIRSGRTLTAVFRNDIVTEHPDTAQPVTGIEIPHWDTLLEIAAQSYELTGLGYQAVDLVLDKRHGPMILEFNARPGLAIQIANRTGLLPRLEHVERHATGLGNRDARVAFAKEHFAAG
ncbi:MAG: alpha-L-glutamate ligase-like protein [Gammaproteobacteria bacterium]|nr:alpha-L-glutamate ligase-like protein [Gammaproteobacteria bacterium]